MGGNLQVKSEPDKGSSFYFTLQLPFVQQANRTPKEPQRGLKDLTGIRILLAEDNAVNMKIAQRFLNSWGATIYTAENGKIAWELFKQQPYDLLLIDLEMPLMAGNQLLPQIRNINKDISTIAFTAAVYENMYADLQKHGFNIYLHN